MKWTCRDRGRWESKDGQWRIEAEGSRSGYGGTVVHWRIKRWDPVTRSWKGSGIKGRHDTLASAKVAVVMFVEDAAR
jgi:hypothetical protein